MASIRAAQSGNWSDPNTWVGGVVPGAGDTVDFDWQARVITLDQDVVIDAINAPYTSSWIVVTGSTPYQLEMQSFTFGSRYLFHFDENYSAVGTSFTVTDCTVGNFTGSNGDAVFNFDPQASGTFELNSPNPIRGDDHATGAEPAIIRTSNPSSTLDITVNADVEGGAAGYTLYFNGGLVTINGNIYPVGNATIYGYNADITINGDVIATGTSVSAVTSVNKLTLNGDILVSSSAPLTGSVINTSTDFDITVNGNIDLSGYTGISTGITGVNVGHASQVGKIVVTGFVKSGGGGRVGSANIVGTYGISSSRLTEVHVGGDLYAGPGGSAIVGDNQADTVGNESHSKLYLTGKTRLVSGYGYNAIERIPLHLTKNTEIIFDGIRTDANWPELDGALIKPLTYHGQGPIASDVRAGSLYGVAAVPPDFTVRSGVPVGDSIGTAALRLTDLANVTGGQIASLSESQGE